MKRLTPLTGLPLKIFEHEKIELDNAGVIAETTASGRYYTCPNGIYPSITTVCAFRGSEFVKDWVARVGKDEARRVGRIAAGGGELLHSMTEALLKNQPIPDAMPVQLHQFRACAKTLLANVGKIYAQEVALYSDKYKVAGRVDVVAEWAGELAVIDFKTSKRPKASADISKYFIQECFYAEAFEEMSGKEINKLVTIMPVEGSTEPLLFVENRSDWIAELKNTINDFYAHKTPR